MNSLPEYGQGAYGQGEYGQGGPTRAVLPRWVLLVAAGLALLYLAVVVSPLPAPYALLALPAVLVSPGVAVLSYLPLPPSGKAFLVLPVSLALCLFASSMSLVGVYVAWLLPAVIAVSAVLCVLAFVRTRHAGGW